MINKAIIPNDTDLIVVSSGEDGNEIQFASDLKSNLDNFKLVSIDAEQRSIVFTASSIDFSSNKVNAVKTTSYKIYFGYKVLIRNRQIVLTDCTSLISHNVLILK